MQTIRLNETVIPLKAVPNASAAEDDVNGVILSEGNRQGED